MQVVDRQGRTGSLGLGCRLPGEVVSMTASGFLDAEAARESVMREMRAVMSARRIEGGETAMLGLLLALGAGEVRATMLARATRNASYRLRALVDGGLLEAVDQHRFAADRRMRRLMLTARGQEAALALVEAIKRVKLRGDA